MTAVLCMKKWAVYALICGLLVSGKGVFANNPTLKGNSNNSHIEHIDRFEKSIVPLSKLKQKNPKKYTLLERMKKYKVNGLSIAVVVDGKLAWAKGYGLADVESGRAVDTETLFQAASISKPVTALAVLHQAEQGLFGLDDNVNEHLKSWQLPDNEYTSSEKVTARRILNHTAGLTVWGFPGYKRGDAIPSLPEILDGKGNTNAVRVFKTPGESVRYSGGGTTILQLMLEDVNEDKFANIMKQQVLTPLNMAASTFTVPLPEKFHSVAATGYRKNRKEVKGKWHNHPEQAAASLWTTPTDLSKYIIAINDIHDGKRDDIISQELINEMLTPGLKNRGLGPVITQDGLRWAHGGANQGFRSMIRSWFAENHGIVIMLNSDNGKIIGEITTAIASEYGWHLPN